MESIETPMSASDGSKVKDEESGGAMLSDAFRTFDAVRPRLFGVAYRMLGSVVDAEDIVQSAWIRWQTTDRSTIKCAEAFLVTVTTRLAITHAKSALAIRRSYIGPWLPEPVDTGADPLQGAERAEGIRIAVMMLLESLSPTERASYILREAFDYTYDQIAEILKTKAVNVRQWVTRARRHLGATRSTPADPMEHSRLLEAFIDAARRDNISALEKLFAADVASIADGGGVVRAARVPIVGRERVAKFLAKLSGHFWTDVTIRRVDANGLPAVALMRGDVVGGFLTVDACHGKIRQLLWVMRPSKLSAFNRSLAGVDTASP